MHSCRIAGGGSMRDAFILKCTCLPLLGYTAGVAGVAGGSSAHGVWSLKDLPCSSRVKPISHSFLFSLHHFLRAGYTWPVSAEER